MPNEFVNEGVNMSSQKHELNLNDRKATTFRFFL